MYILHYATAELSNDKNQKYWKTPLSVFRITLLLRIFITLIAIIGRYSNHFLTLH